MRAHFFLLVRANMQIGAGLRRAEQYESGLAVLREIGAGTVSPRVPVARLPAPCARTALPADRRGQPESIPSIRLVRTLQSLAPRLNQPIPMRPWMVFTPGFGVVSPASEMC